MYCSPGSSRNVALLAWCRFLCSLCLTIVYTLIYCVITTKGIDHMTTAIIRVSDCSECQKPRATTTTIDYEPDLFGDVDVYVDGLLAADIEIGCCGADRAYYDATIHGSGGNAGPSDRFHFYSESDDERRSALTAAKLFIELRVAAVTS